MDRIFIYLFTVLAVTTWIPNIGGVTQIDSQIRKGLNLSEGESDLVVGQKSEPLLLGCSVQYDPDLGPLTFNWTKDGYPLEESRRVQVLENGSLYIRRVLHRPKKAVSDEGRYKCFVTLKKVGTVIGRNVLVQIAGIERKFDIEPQPVSAPVGGVARFQCQIIGVPPVLYIWYRNKTALPQTNNRYLTLNSGILQITGVTDDDAGLYRCYATQGSLHEKPGEVQDVDGKYSVEASLTVIKGPPPSQVQIVSSSHNVTAKVRTPAILECLVQGFAGNAVWWKDGKEVTSSPRIERVGNNLILLETEISDGGKYECKTGNEMATMQLNVIRKPVITDITNSSRKPKGSWHYLKCSAEGHPMPTITWLKNGTKVKLDNNIKERKGNQLVILQSETYHSGYYQCMASNEAGTVWAFTRLEVFMEDNVPYPPTNLKATVVTSTSIFVSWEQPKQGARPLAYSIHVIGPQGNDQVIPDTSLTIMALKPFSNYSIYVAPYSSDGAGPRSQEITVTTLEDVPSRAPLITLEPGSSNIQVKWGEMRADQRNGIIRSYKIYYRVLGSKTSEKVLDSIPGTAKNYLIKDLEPETEYEVRVLAATSVGFPRLSDERWPWISVTTMDDNYVIVPELSITALNNTAMKTSWTYTSSFSIKHIVIQLQQLDTGDILQTETLAADTREFVFSGLDANANYEVIVTVETVDGQQAEAVEQMNLSSLPKPPVPRNLNIVLSNMDSLSVEWEVIGTNSMEVTSFTVKYAQLIEGSIKGPEIKINSNVNFVLLEKLQPFTRYEVSVRANSPDMYGRYSSPIIGRTLEGVPSEPQNIQIVTVRQGSVSVSWNPPAQPNGQIKSYTIYYTNVPDHSDDPWVRVVKNGTEHSAVITFSDSTKIYYIKLQASTAKGPGKETSPILVDPNKIPVTDRSTNEEDKQLGIIIGVSIGVVCIIICIIIILLRHRCIGTSNNRQPQTQPARFQGNGHIPGNGNGHAHMIGESRGMVDGVYEMDTYTPMLGEHQTDRDHVYTPMMGHLPENEHSDSKGGGSGNIILTPNGAKLNGFVPLKKNGVKNGHMNGHMTSFLPSHYKDDHVDPEERRELINAMLGKGREPCITIGDDSFTTTRDEDLGSLDNIDKGSSSEDVNRVGHIHGRRKRVETSGEDSGEGSLSHSSSERNSTGYVSSVPLSDTTDTGDTVIYCGESGISGMSVGFSGERSSLSDGPISAGSCMESGVGGNVSYPRSISPLKDNNIPQSYVTSASCEDTCHDGGTRGGGQGEHAIRAALPSPTSSASSSNHQESPHSNSASVLPQIQVSTSNLSQASSVQTSNRSVNVTQMNNSANPTSTYVTGYNTCNGVLPGVESGVYSDENRPRQQLPPTRRRHPASPSSNGAPPQFQFSGNAGSQPIRPTQGRELAHVGIGLPTSIAGGHNSNSPELRGDNSPVLRGETTSLRDTSCTELPQDAGYPATSSSRKRHYQV